MRAPLAVCASLVIGGFVTSAVAGPTLHARAATSGNGTGIGSGKIALIEKLLNETATQSWEIGAHMEALLEWKTPALAVFASNSMPPPSSPVATEVLTTATEIVQNKSANSLQLIPDGSSSDPASVGVPVILANWTGPANGAVSPSQFATAAQQQLESLLGAPRASNGAISHRLEQVQLWSDFVYMAPPFMAYMGVLTQNRTLVQAAYDQCRLYRDLLRTSSGLWIHILYGTNADPGLWASGNGWAAAGMLRVAATLMHSDVYASDFAQQISDLGQWSSEIVTAAFALQQSNGLFPNYFNDTSTFSDASSTALLAATSYRLAQLKIATDTLDKAEIARQAVYAAVSPSTGILSPVVDPLDYSSQGKESPEGEAFVLLLEAGWRDYYQGTGGTSTEATSAASVSYVLPLQAGGMGQWIIGLTVVVMAALWQT